MLDDLLKASPLIVLIGTAIAWVVDKRTGWLSNAAQKVAQEREATREALSDEFSRLQTMNDKLSKQIQELAPNLEAMRQEYFEAVQREIELIDEVRTLKARSSANTLYLYKMAQAIKEQNDYIADLRSEMEHAGMTIAPAPNIAVLLEGIPEVEDILVPKQVTPKGSPKSQKKR